MSPLTMHPARWTSPQPLWGRFGAVGSSAAFRSDDQARPALLRFASDEFMEQLLGILQTDPDRLGELIARPETWRDPPGSLPEPTVPKTAALPPRAVALARRRAGSSGRSELTATAPTQTREVNGVRRQVPLKLYHPAHQRHYLVAANLVCAIPGFPDKGLGTGGREQVSFVLRRLMKESEQQGAPEHEYAFVRDARGPHWERVPPEGAAADAYQRSVPGEETLPLFSLTYRDGSDHPRHLLAGIIPVGRREEYLGVRRYEAPQPTGATTGTLAADPAAAQRTKISARKEQLKLDVTEPWKALIRSLYKTLEPVNKIDPSSTFATPLASKQAAALAANEGAQLQSWLILLDFADYLRNHVPEVYAAVTSTAANPTLAHAGRNSLLSWLKTAAMPAGYGWQITGTFATSLRDALRRIHAPGVREGLERAERSFVLDGPGQTDRPAWPPFQFLLSGIGVQTTTNTFSVVGVQDTPITGVGPESEDDVEVLPEPSGAETAAGLVDKLVQLVVAALDADATTPAPPVPFAAQLRDAMKEASPGPGWFVIRCCYVHHDCTGLHRTVISAPSQRFQLASFFDSDAPARPIRIALPIDATAAGMRKHQKNTAFVLSDVLCGQANRLKGLGFIDLVLHVLPWPFHKDLDVGAKGIGPCKSTGGVNFGMICSLSIPIITICALILLFMIVLVLDFIFKWIPWFIVCWPLPKFKAKEPT